PELGRERLERTRGLMNTSVRDCLVTNYEHLEAIITLPDSNDRHVLAAAIACRADSIVTFNLKDFPDAALAPYAIEAMHPDEFISHQIGLSSALVCGAAKKHRARLKHPA